ncbi:MAG: thiamine-phosphate kinase [Candidatus Limnocylindria bacterium]
MSAASENDLVERWRNRIPSGHGVVLGPGDDAALVEMRPGELAVLTTDMLVEGVHFRREWGAADDLGWKSAAVNLSDLAAMGARPGYLLAAVALPADFEQAFADGLLDGLLECARAFDAPLVGGDTVRSGGPYVVSVTAVGSVAAHAALRRDAARPGDVVAVTGHLGGAAAALRIFDGGGIPDPRLGARLLRPVPRLAEARALAAAGIRCAIDCSDGLARSALFLAQASGCAIEIDGDRIPVQDGASVEDALDGGEDYELVVTGPAAAIERAGPLLTALGRVAAGAGAVLVAPDGRRSALLGGYDAFETTTPPRA